MFAQVQKQIFHDSVAQTGTIIRVAAGTHHSAVDGVRFGIQMAFFVARRVLELGRHAILCERVGHAQAGNGDGSAPLDVHVRRAAHTTHQLTHHCPAHFVGQ